MREVTIQVPVYRPDSGLGRPWPPSYHLNVQVHAGHVLIRGDSAGLQGLAVQLLALAGEDVPAGYHGDLDEGIELDSGSAGLTIMRT
jgi:hypothetical protein